ncbi:uncharacterized protein PSFLO_07775 [Pseudozyma flocculosa]|uniref:Uncharacterized protein n=1 Tax=Pseudozyma flocculosa TaxID=84751 RepID=A0A5C3FD05_9BASI|nr:uncharacterized protein PSFLO_07775 [Pseudozyma flocculosa]
MSNMKIFIRYFCIVYKELTEVDLALKHQEILFKSDLEDEHERARLLAIEWVMWWRNSVFDPNGCMASSLVGYGCRRPTVAGCLKYAWVDGRVLWLKVTMVDCLFCLKHLELCHTIVSDNKRHDKCCVVNSTGVLDPTFDVKKTGLSTDLEPAFDDPAHYQPIFGWSLLESDRHRRKANVLVFEFTTQSSLFSTTTATFGQLPRTSSRHQQCSATITATKAATLPHHPHTKDGIASVLINATRIISKTAVTASCDKPSTSLPAVLTPSSASPALFTAAAAVHGPQVKVSSSADRIALAQTKLMTNMPPPPPPLRSQDTSPDGGADARSQVICHPAL